MLAVTQQTFNSCHYTISTTMPNPIQVPSILCVYVRCLKNNAHLQINNRVGLGDGTRLSSRQKPVEIVTLQSFHLPGK